MVASASGAGLFPWFWVGVLLTGEVGQEQGEGPSGQEVHQLPVELRAGGYGGNQAALGFKVGKFVGKVK